MSLLDRIANYFKEWDGIDETAPKMELSIYELRYIADMNVERCRLIRQLNEANLKTEKIRAKAIEEFAEKFIFKAVCEGCSGCCNCHEEGQQSECEDWKAYMEIAKEMRGAE